MNRRDREIALRAIAARATGKPEVAAAEILAGIAVLDGRHFPILLWPLETSREEKAAWHRAEAAYWEESVARVAALTQHPGSAARTHLESHGDQSTDGQDQPLPYSASSQLGRHEAEIENPRPDQCSEDDRGASDAC
ncbi:hypothetical protein [Pseudomonas asplenii]|uniref:hypothetical protein n=1 Tax=Pseudomonas asplenii TaxID=53407 RepID=UPI0012BC46B4|nr:hypothetical protein [Pseudomonas fuscovaginae]